MYYRQLPMLILACFFTFSLSAQEVVKNDSVKTEKKNIFKRIYEYFEQSNEVSPDKRFDFSIIGGPHYSNDTKLGIGLLASGLFRLDRSDLEMSPSNVSLYGDITTTGAYVVGISGNILFPQMKYRIDSDVKFSHRPSRYWGIGYDAGRANIYTKYDNQLVELKFDFLKKLFTNTYLGVTTNFKDIQGKNFNDITLLAGEKSHTTALGAGLILSYDSRDFIPNPYKGIYAKAEFLYYPKFLGSTFEFNKTELLFRAYQRVWKGGVLAFDLHGVLNNGDVSWNMMSVAGTAYQMRGYYAGRYRDRNSVQTQLELRQHIYRRNGIAVWVGAGNVFHKMSAFDFGQTLPNFGFGYRWEFKNRVNVRIDYGIGKGESGFYFNINEAF